MGILANLALPPYKIFFLPFFIFPILLYLIISTTDASIDNKTKIRKKFFLGYFFGCGYFFSSLFWLGSTIINEAQIPLLFFPLCYLILPSILSIYYGLAFALTAVMGKSKFSFLIAFVINISFFEWLRSVLFTGFPWNLIAYMAAPFPVTMQLISLIGISGLMFFSILIFSLPLLFFYKKTRTTSILFFIFLLLIWFGWGVYRLSNAPNIADQPSNVTIRIVQPSITASLRWQANYSEYILDKLINLSLQKSKLSPNKAPDIILWSETAIPYIVKKNDLIIKRLAKILLPEQILISGALRGEKDKIFNSIIAINNQANIIAYKDKSHLVPFGEYIPFSNYLKKLPIREFTTIPAGFTAGEKNTNFTINSKLSFLALICYEVIFSPTISLIDPPLQAILNVSNDGWYGNTAGPHQHFHQAQLRAVSLGIPLIRAANNGISAVVDSYGRVISSLGYNEIGVIDSYIPATADSIIKKFDDEKLFFFWLLLYITSYLFTIYRFNHIILNNFMDKIHHKRNN
ncbi:apolipoprotein N-acyltransferase [Bartonella sp. DGB1]|uniref:apolipoprotein N-acyltransferase n=1 Tax=Bartonella sp. DGB1 TaxID=3239807 RepID=UPI003525981E